MCHGVNLSLSAEDNFCVGSASGGSHKSGYKLRNVGKSPKSGKSPSTTLQTSGNTSGDLILPNPHTNGDLILPNHYKISVNPVPQKGTWKRIKKERRVNIKGEKSLGVGSKRRVSESVDVITMDLEKKQKREEDSKVMFQASQFEAAEVARQPRWEQ